MQLSKKMNLSIKGGNEGEALGQTDRQAATRQIDSEDIEK